MSHEISENWNYTDIKTVVKNDIPNEIRFIVGGAINHQTYVDIIFHSPYPNQDAVICSFMLKVIDDKNATLIRINENKTNQRVTCEYPGNVMDDTATIFLFDNKKISGK